MAKKVKRNEMGRVSIISLILMALGIFFLVSGFVTQTDSFNFWNWWSLLYYFVGLALISFGKVCHGGMCGVKH